MELLGIPGLHHIQNLGHDMGGTSAEPRSDRDRVIATSALSVGYGREVGMIMLIYIMAFAYAAVSPIILPFTLCYFTSSWVRSKSGSPPDCAIVMSSKLKWAWQDQAL